MYQRNMKRLLNSFWSLIVILLILTGFYIWGIQFVPFHPDETTYLFMGSDFDSLIANPKSLYWDPDKATDPRQRYRELDAPITRYLLGLSRWIKGRETQQVDWDWAASWDANLAAGAYPVPDVLQTGRLIITLMLPISLGLIYLVGKRLNGHLTGTLATLLLGTNAVVLLHNRRAMAEGALLFGILLATWSILKAHESPWLTGIGMSLAFNSKHSAMALIPVALIALVWLPRNTPRRFERISINLFQFALVFVLITYSLNPFLWNQPFRAVQSAMETRSALADQQAKDILTIAPGKSLESPLQRVFVLLLNLAISPPEYGLVGNLSPTSDDVEAYIAMPGHNIFRGIYWGGISLVLLAFGIVMAMRKAVGNRSDLQRDHIILLLATLSIIGGLLVVVRIYWIRYTIPAIPFVCIWIAYGLASLFEKQSPGKA